MGSTVNNYIMTSTHFMRTLRVLHSLYFENVDIDIGNGF